MRLLCLGFDALLLVSAILYGIVPLIVLEVYALVADLARLPGAVRGPG